MPIKRSEHIVKLSREHHFSLLFVWKIRQGINHQVEPDRIKKYIRYFQTQHLIPHFQDEENILFVLQPHHTGVQKAIREHEIIKALLQKASADHHKSEDAYSAFWELADQLDVHVRFEERILFPELESKLTPAQLKSVGHVLNHDALEKPADDYEDEFWVQKK